MLQDTVTLQAKRGCQRLVPHLLGVMLSPIPILYGLTCYTECVYIQTYICVLTIHVFHKQIYLSGQ